MNLLLIEDNEMIVNGLEYSFKQTGYNLISKATIKEALDFINNEIVSLVILDISLPDGNGIDLFKEVIHTNNIPTIFLTAKDDEETIVECLNIGAEDYITKPFSTKELIARVNKIILRQKNNTIIKIKNIKFDIDKMIVYKDDEKINFTSLELNILQLLFLNVDKVVRRDIILDKIWEWTGNDVDNHTITVYLKRIREKLGVDIITTIKGIGYRIDRNEE